MSDSKYLQIIIDAEQRAAEAFQSAAKAEFELKSYKEGAGIELIANKVADILEKRMLERESVFAEKMVDILLNTPFQS